MLNCTVVRALRGQHKFKMETAVTTSPLNDSEVRLKVWLKVSEKTKRNRINSIMSGRKVKGDLQWEEY